MSVVVDVNTKPQAATADNRTWSTAGDTPHWQAAKW
jgi:hypothetical protein